MNELLQKRLELQLDTVTTVQDYATLLRILSEKTGEKVDDLRGGKGGWTYRQWNERLSLV